jgi:hypothetical protein
MADPDCLTRQQEAGLTPDPHKCKKFALRARSRLVFDTHRNRDRPRGHAKVRFILVATFFIKTI